MLSSREGLPWAQLTTSRLLSEFRSLSDHGELNVMGFARLLSKMLFTANQNPTDTANQSYELASQLFACFDRNGNGLLNLRELFTGALFLCSHVSRDATAVTDLLSGMTMLCAQSQHDRLMAAFQIIDANGTGLLSGSELTCFLMTIAPPAVSQVDVMVLVARIFAEADVDRSGLLSYNEVRDKVLCLYRRKYCCSCSMR